MYKVDIGSFKNGYEIRFSGFLDISNIDNILEEVQDLQLGEKEVKVKIEEVETLDLSFLQVLLALKKKIEGGGRCEVEWDINEEYERLLEVTGFKADLA